MRRVASAGILWIAVLAALPLPGRSQAVPGAGYTYRVPVQMEDGWPTASLADVGMDTDRMVAFMNDLAGYPDHWVHGVIVVKDGKLVFEAYFPGEDLDLRDLAGGLAFRRQDFDASTLHSMASVTKSVTSLLVGIALDEGLLSGTDQTLFSFFPDHADLADEAKSRITLEQMLSMTAGMPWNEGYAYGDPRNDLTAMIDSEDPVAYALDRPVVTEPGTRFLYDSGNANLLGEIVRRASGVTLTEFAERHLFGPLGIDGYEWYPFPHAPELAVASSSLYLRPRDMAKLGQLVLDGGRWNGTRVVSEEWIRRSTARAVGMSAEESPIPGLDPAYGLLWWLGTFETGPTETWFAAGWGGEFIFVLPQLDMVVAFTSGGYENAHGYDAIVQIMNRYVLPAAGR